MWKTHKLKKSSHFADRPPHRQEEFPHKRTINSDIRLRIIAEQPSIDLPLSTFDLRQSRSEPLWHRPRTMARFSDGPSTHAQRGSHRRTARRPDRQTARLRETTHETPTRFGLAWPSAIPEILWGEQEKETELELERVMKTHPTANGRILSRSITK
jgi:hypothetical protein